MPKKTIPPETANDARRDASFDRRVALRGLGVLVAAPVIAACREDRPGMSALDGGAGGSGGAGGGGAGGSGAGGGGAGAGGAGNGGAGAGGAGGAGGADARDAGVEMPPSPMFDPVATCVLTPTDPAGEGPFFIHDAEVMNDPSLFRSDMRDGTAGLPLQINLRMLDSSQTCATAISGVEVYVWHTNALGFYSGFNGQTPDMPYTGGAERTPDNLDRFCRGAQVTDAAGVVSFTSVFPGWYNGRAIHIHFLALRKGSGPGTTSYRGQQYHVFTTQFYFDEQVSRSVHENNAPYTTRASGAAYNMYVKPETNVRPTVTGDSTNIIASLNILTNPAMSRG